MLESQATSLYWYKEKSVLYIGHASGAVSAYKISMITKKHKIMQEYEASRVDKPLTSMEKLQKIIRSKDQGQGAEAIIKNLTREELMEIYPELK